MSTGMGITIEAGDVIDLMDQTNDIDIATTAAASCACASSSSTSQTERFLIVDVRDDDYDEGGHIRGAINIPSTTFLNNNETMKMLFEKCILEHIQIVMFHCAYSQVRGPACRKHFSNYCESYVAVSKSKKNGNGNGKEGERDADPDPLAAMRVVFIRGGFNGFAERYGGTEYIVSS